MKRIQRSKQLASVSTALASARVWPRQAWTVWQFLAFAAPALAGFGLAVGLHTWKVPQRDIFLLFNAWAADHAPGMWAALTMLGNTSVLVCLLSPLMLLRPQIVVAIVAAMPAGGLLSLAFKRFFDAPRPADLIDPAQFNVVGVWLTGNSFPSGHTITAFAAAAAVCACHDLHPRAVTKRWMNVATVALACLVGASRVAVGAHWPLDVLAGASLGWLAGLTGVWVCQRWPCIWQTAMWQWAVVVSICAASWLVHSQATGQPSAAWVVWLATTCAAVTLGWMVQTRLLIERKS
jgi:membrane-associated phospholipid phosphatase